MSICGAYALWRTVGVVMYAIQFYTQLMTKSTAHLSQRLLCSKSLNLITATLSDHWRYLYL